MMMIALPVPVVVGGPHRHRDAGGRGLPGRLSRSSGSGATRPPQIARTMSFKRAVRRRRGAQVDHQELRRHRSGTSRARDRSAPTPRHSNSTIRPSPPRRCGLSMVPNAARSCRNGPRAARSAPRRAEHDVSPGDGFSSSAAPGLAPIACRAAGQNGGMPEVFARSVDIACCSSFMPLMPSISERCIFTNSAKPCSSSPSMMVHSRRAREVDRRVLQAADQLAELALAARPGQAAWRTWCEVDGRGLDPRRHRVQIEGVLQAPVPRRGEAAVGRNSAIMRRRWSRGAFSGRRRSATRRLWLGVARVSVMIQAASGQLRRTSVMGAGLSGPDAMAPRRRSGGDSGVSAPADLEDRVGDRSRCAS